jgi:hypothetical protein
MRLLGFLLFLALALGAAGYARPFDNIRELRKYNVVWDRPGSNSKGSMPIGNGDIGLNVWAEADTGSVCFYISKTDSWDENGRLLKLSAERKDPGERGRENTGPEDPHSDPSPGHAEKLARGRRPTDRPGEGNRPLESMGRAHGLLGPLLG